MSFTAHEAVLMAAIVFDFADSIGFVYPCRGCLAGIKICNSSKDVEKNKYHGYVEEPYPVYCLFLALNV